MSPVSVKSCYKYKESGVDDYIVSLSITGYKPKTKISGSIFLTKIPRFF